MMQQFFAQEKIDLIENYDPAREASDSTVFCADGSVALLKPGEIVTRQLLTNNRTNPMVFDMQVGFVANNGLAVWLCSLYDYGVNAEDKCLVDHTGGVDTNNMEIYADQDYSEIPYRYSKIDYNDLWKAGLPNKESSLVQMHTGGGETTMCIRWLRNADNFDTFDLQNIQKNKFGEDTLREIDELHLEANRCKHIPLGCIIDLVFAEEWMRRSHSTKAKYELEGLREMMHLNKERSKFHDQYGKEQRAFNEKRREIQRRQRRVEQRKVESQKHVEALEQEMKNYDAETEKLREELSKIQPSMVDLTKEQVKIKIEYDARIKELMARAKSEFEAEQQRIKNKILELDQRRESLIVSLDKIKSKKHCMRMSCELSKDESMAMDAEIDRCEKNISHARENWIRYNNEYEHKLKSLPEGPTPSQVEAKRIEKYQSHYQDQMSSIIQQNTSKRNDHIQSSQVGHSQGNSYSNSSNGDDSKYEVYSRSQDKWYPATRHERIEYPHDGKTYYKFTYNAGGIMTYKYLTLDSKDLKTNAQ